MKLEVVPRFVREFGRLSVDDQAAYEAAVDKLSEAFGNPHRHADRGIRALRRGVYEGGAGLAMRIGITRCRDTLYLRSVEGHETIRQWLRSAKA